jgi:hypothetical protein
VVRGVRPVAIEGEGFLENFAWETPAGYAVHLLNYTNPNLHKGWLRRHYPIGIQKVRMVLPANATVVRVELLRAESRIPFRMEGNTLEFTIPSVTDYEIAAIYA